MASRSGQHQTVVVKATMLKLIRHLQRVWHKGCRFVTQIEPHFGFNQPACAVFESTSRCVNAQRIGRARQSTIRAVAPSYCYKAIPGTTDVPATSCHGFEHVPQITISSGRQGTVTVEPGSAPRIFVRWTSDGRKAAPGSPVMLPGSNQ